MRAVEFTYSERPAMAASAGAPVGASDVVITITEETETQCRTLNY